MSEFCHFCQFPDEGAAEGGKGSLQCLKEGTEVVVHYSKAGGDTSAVEIDRIGKL